LDAQEKRRRQNSPDNSLAGKLKAALKGLKRSGEYVFTNPRTRTCYDYREKLMGSLCRKAGVKPFSFHALRHYGASTLAAKGAPLADIQAILGHELLTTTSSMFKVLKQAREKQLLFWMKIKKSMLEVSIN